MKLLIAIAFSLACPLAAVHAEDAALPVAVAPTHPLIRHTGRELLTGKNSQHHLTLDPLGVAVIDLA